MHRLFGLDDVAWLGRFKDLGLTDDHAPALVVIREAGAITNVMFRDINGVDPLAASGALRGLRDPWLLAQRGKAKLRSPAQREAAKKDERRDRSLALRSSRSWESVGRRAGFGKELEQTRGPRARIRKEEPHPSRRPPTAKEV